MSQSGMERFLAAVETDADLARRLQSAEDRPQLVSEAQHAGYDVSLEELQAAARVLEFRAAFATNPQLAEKARITDDLDTLALAANEAGLDVTAADLQMVQACTTASALPDEGLDAAEGHLWWPFGKPDPSSTKPAPYPKFD